MNRWNIPQPLEREILARDRRCVYCGIEFQTAPHAHGARASWEHIINDAKIITRENIARCCIACNASKGDRPLVEWLQSAYCRRKGITIDSVAPIVRVALQK